MKASLKQRFLFVFLVLFLLASACSLPAKQAEPTEVSSEYLAQTAAVKTIDALMTEIAGQNITATPGGLSTSTSTPPSGSIIPSSTPLPTATQVVLPSFTPTFSLPCDKGEFVTDVSVPDGTAMPINTQFVKTWRLRNTGRCTWTADYAVVYDSGNGMSGPAAQSLGAAVPPGQTVDISVTMRAPADTGVHRGNWKLRNASGVVFGTGSTNQPFYVEIHATGPASTTGGYDFAGNYCVAEWTGNNKAIPCQGKEGDDDGFVLYKSKPVLENNYVDDEPGLITHPPEANDSVIRGNYPTYIVKNGDRFKSVIGCEYNASGCSVRFQLDYTIDNGAIQTLSAWNENYDSNTTSIDVDLSSLAGKNVRFILTVLSNGSWNKDRAQWLAPRIESKPPTPTVTPTVTPTLPAYPYP